MADDPQADAIYARIMLETLILTLAQTGAVPKETLKAVVDLALLQIEQVLPISGSNQPTLLIAQDRAERFLRLLERVIPSQASNGRPGA